MRVKHPDESDTGTGETADPQNGLYESANEMVGVERFELPTSCSQSRRATRLRYTPKRSNEATGRLGPDHTDLPKAGQTPSVTFQALYRRLGEIIQH